MVKARIQAAKAWDGRTMNNIDRIFIIATIRIVG